MDWSKSEILITGGTGSLGKTIVKHLLTYYKPKGIRIYSRDELKQWELKQKIPTDVPVSFLIGDVRDCNRLERAMHGVDIVINTAAMKQVPACEYNPIEAVNTNINGAKNIIDAAINQGVDRVMHISTDKAVYPINLYGATKTVAEKLFLHANVYAGDKGTKFSCCRYGNVIGSRGSIVPLFAKQLQESGSVTITDLNMTRFWITLDRVVDLILCAIELTTGAEIFVPKMPSCTIEEVMYAVARIVGSTCYEVKIIGIRPGEKIHECLISEEESDYIIDDQNSFYVLSNVVVNKYAERFSYTSDNNFWKVDHEYIQNMIQESKLEL